MRSRREFIQALAGVSFAGVRASYGFLASQTTGLVGVAMGHSLIVGKPAEMTNDRALAIKTLTRNFVEHAGVSACQIAVVSDGKLVLSQAYAVKPPSGYAPVTNRSLFRIASCSKMFTCAAITELRSMGKLDMDAKVFPLLGITAPAMAKDKPDSRINDITVRHLVNHAGGWNDHESATAKDGTHIPGTEWDPMFGIRKIALDMRLKQPPSKLEIAGYMYGKPLQFTPGTQDFNSTHEKSYSNLGYLLLGLVVEKVSGKSFIDFVRTELNSESDTSSVYVSELLTKVRNPREVWYETSGTKASALDPRSSEVVSNAYGGGFIPDLQDSAGGTMTTAETLALFGSRHAVWGLGGRAPNSGRSGSMPGTSSFTYSRPNGMDAAFILNTRDFNGGTAVLGDFTAALQRLLDQV